MVALAMAGPALAFDGVPDPAGEPSPVEAFRMGTKAYKAGDMAGASKALSFAAGKGHALAQWKLARMYAEGDGVPHDDAKAFAFYEDIVEAHADDNPDMPQSRFVSNAFVALGSYYVSGIPGSDVHPDLDRAAEMFRYAASYFGDSDAQYNLGRLYLEGSPNRPRDPITAARWLKISANKGQRQAQAVLGHMLFAGADLPRQSALGLMYLTLARDAATGEADRWIVDLYDEAVRQAKPEERKDGLAYLESYLKDRGPN